MLKFNSRIYECYMKLAACDISFKFMLTMVANVLHQQTERSPHELDKAAVKMFNNFIAISLKAMRDWYPDEFDGIPSLDFLHGMPDTPIFATSV